MRIRVQAWFGGAVRAAAVSVVTPRIVTPRAVTVLATTAVLAAVAVDPSPALAQQEDPEALAVEMGVTETEIADVVLGFKAALAEGDSTGALEYLHPELVVFESGHAETLEQYRAGHLAADMEFAGAVEFEITDSDVRVRPQTALAISQYTTKGTFRGRQIDAHGVETMVLVPVDDAWKILHIHWSSR